MDIQTPDRLISVAITGDEAAVTVAALDQWSSPSRQLVAEMMVLAGEAVAAFGAPRDSTPPREVEVLRPMPKALALHAACTWP